MIEHYMRTRTKLPAPNFDPSKPVVAVSDIVDLKLMLYQGMVWNDITQAELAKRLGTSPVVLPTAGSGSGLEARADSSGHGCDRRAAADQVPSKIVDAAAGAPNRSRLYVR